MEDYDAIDGILTLYTISMIVNVIEAFYLNYNKKKEVYNIQIDYKFV